MLRPTISRMHVRRAPTPSSPPQVGRELTSQFLSCRRLRTEHQDPRHPEQPNPQGELSLSAQLRQNNRRVNSLWVLTALPRARSQSPQNWQTSVGLPFFKIEGTERACDSNFPRPARSSPAHDVL